METLVFLSTAEMSHNIAGLRASCLVACCSNSLVFATLTCGAVEEHLIKVQHFISNPRHHNRIFHPPYHLAEYT